MGNAELVNPFTQFVECEIGQHLPVNAFMPGVLVVVGAMTWLRAMDLSELDSPALAAAAAFSSLKTNKKDELVEM